MESCFHCGDICSTTTISHQDKSFCCNGCKTVFDILNDNDLSYYYDLEKTPGTSPLAQEGKFDFLENSEIIKQLVEFDEDAIQVVSFLIPSIHCSSCIWVLENLNKLDPAIRNAQINFPKKTLRVSYKSTEISLKQLVLLLSRIGYEPYISLEDATKKGTIIDRGLIYKIGVAGFAFGNIMFLSFPEYFEVDEFWLNQYKHVFRWLMFALSLPVITYAARDYFISAFKGLRSKILNIDVPIALGIIVLFLRSSVDIMMNWGSGYFDSMSGLVFFLLLGKFFQQKTYAFLSFERDYKSYFPIAVTRLQKKNSSSEEIEEQAQVYELKKGDRILIRNSELLPVDGILIKGTALIDYSFVTGEAAPLHKSSGDMLYAGGRQQAGSIEVEVLKSIEQSYLTQLWSNEVFDKNKESTFQSLTDKISKSFTISLLSIAIFGFVGWMFIDSSKALNVFTAVLIVACPCAIALAAPFTLGNLLRIFGSNKLYIKDSSVIEQMAHVDTVVFDKTGTLTTTSNNIITYEGISLTTEEESLLTSTLRASNHSLSRQLYELLNKNEIQTLDDFEENVGQGITGVINKHHIKVGSISYVGINSESLKSDQRTAVHISTDNQYKGCYIFYNDYRQGIQPIFDSLAQDREIIILSGDNDGEKENLLKLLPANSKLLFNQKPEDKLSYIHSLQKKGKKVMMIGDGLNDAGALAQSDVGISISENVNIFSPACDGILDASRFQDLTTYLEISKKGVKTIKNAFRFSLFYNIIGLGFALSGNLAPVVAAILMPLSSISIVIFTTLVTYRLGKNLNKF